MPIDSFILNSMLDPFKKMLDEINSRNINNDAVEQMKKLMNRMEQLGQEHSDLNDFNTSMMQENLFAEFSNAYTKALSENQQETQNTGSSASYDDSALLQQTISSLKQTITDLQANYQNLLNSGNIEQAVLNNPEQTINNLQKLLKLAETENISYASFLRLQIEKGLDKIQEGAFAEKNSLQFEYEMALVQSESPYHIEKAQKKIDTFDNLASKNKFNLPDTKELSFALKDIDYEYQPKIAEWKAISKFIKDLFYDLYSWSLSYTSKAPYIEPWSQANNPQEAVKKDQKTLPGIFKQREKLLSKYFGLNFNDIPKHENFKWLIEKGDFDYSQELTSFLINKIYPQMKPFNDLPSDLISEREEFYNSKTEFNPNLNAKAKALKEFYDKKFGSGIFEKKYGQIQEVDTNAQAYRF